MVTSAHVAGVVHLIIPLNVVLLIVSTWVFTHALISIIIFIIDIFIFFRLDSDFLPVDFNVLVVIFIIVFIVMTSALMFVFVVLAHATIAFIVFFRDDARVKVLVLLDLSLHFGLIEHDIVFFIIFIMGLLLEMLILLGHVMLLLRVLEIFFVLHLLAEVVLLRVSGHSRDHIHQLVRILVVIRLVVGGLVSHHLVRLKLLLVNRLTLLARHSTCWGEVRCS